MSGILMSSSPENINSASSPQFQSWSIQPGVIEIDYLQGSASPQPVTVQCKLQDIVGTNVALGYHNFIYRSYISSSTGGAVFAVMSGPLYTGLSNSAPYTNGLTGEIIITFQNLNQLAAGTYNLNVKFEIRGKKMFHYETLSSYDLAVKLRVFNSDAPQISPALLNYTWTMGEENDMLMPLNINGPLWSIMFPNQLVPGGVNLNITSLPGGGKVVSGSGPKTIYVTATNAAVATYTTQNPLQYNLIINGGLLSVPVTVTVVQPNGLYLSHDSLAFVALKGLTEAQPLSLDMHYPGPYHLQLPAWLSVVPSSGTGTSNTVVAPLPAINMGAGNYEGQIKVLLDSDQTVLGAVAVLYRVVEFLDNPYQGNAFAFTLDPVFFEFVSQLDNIYYLVKLTAEVSAFYTGQTITHTYTYKVPLFKKKQRFNVGKVVERLLASMPDLQQEHEVPYQAANVTLEINALSMTDPDYTDSYIVTGLNFISGIDPGMVNGFGILDINPGPQRVMPNGYRYINTLCKGSTAASVFRNGVELEGHAIPAGLYTLKLDFASLGVSKGDVIEFRLYAGLQTISKYYHVFPPGINNVVVVWENEYRLKSVMELTGEHNIKTEFENKTQTIYENLVSRLKKFENNKTGKLSINTGFLQQSDQATIESLCRARRALIVSEGKVLQAVPVAKAIENVNTTRDLVSFDLEFELIPSTNEEVYTL